MAGDARRQVIQRVVRLACEASWRIAEDLLGESQRRVPLDEGTLAGTGTVVLLVNGLEFDSLQTGADAAVLLALAGSLNRVRARVSYDTVYAAAQHEAIALMHRDGHTWIWQARHYSKPGRGPQYLRAPLLERAGKYRQALELTIDAGLR